MPYAAVFALGAPDIVLSFPVLFYAWRNERALESCLVRARPNLVPRLFHLTGEMKEPGNEVGLAPGSEAQQYGGRHGSQRSPQIDDFTKSTNLHKEKWLEIWKVYPFLYWGKISGVNKDCGESENMVWMKNARVHPICIL